jgi:hypothetical protein
LYGGCVSFYVKGIPKKGAKVERWTSERECENVDLAFFAVIMAIMPNVITGQNKSKSFSRCVRKKRPL